MDSLLQTVALYRKKDPATMDEEECMENLFQCVCTTLLLPGKSMVVGELLSQQPIVYAIQCSFFLYVVDILYVLHSLFSYLTMLTAMNQSQKIKTSF